MQIKGEIKSERLTVLVVEDDPDIRELFRLTLEVAGYHVIGAENGIEPKRSFDDRQARKY